MLALLTLPKKQTKWLDIAFGCVWVSYEVILSSYWDYF
jgi:hypothetical protein